MNSIILPLTIGKETKELTLSFPNGHEGIADIYIDKYYHGQVVKTSLGWRVYLGAKSFLSPEDARIIVEALEGKA